VHVGLGLRGVAADRGAKQVEATIQLVHSGRVRLARWVLLAVMASGVVAFAVITVDLALADCGSFEADAAAFRDERQEGRGPRLRQRAETLVRCGHREFAYNLGTDAGSVSNTEVALFMEVDRGRVAYASVDGESRKVADGEPVGGGPRPAP
jgi:hypothetical protein